MFITCPQRCMITYMWLSPSIQGCYINFLKLTVIKVSSHFQTSYDTRQGRRCKDPTFVLLTLFLAVIMLRRSSINQFSWLKSCVFLAGGAHIRRQRFVRRAGPDVQHAPRGLGARADPGPAVGHGPPHLPPHPAQERLQEAQAVRRSPGEGAHAQGIAGMCIISWYSQLFIL